MTRPGMQSEALAPARAPESLAGVLDALVARRFGEGLVHGRRAAAAWALANGDRERLHTCGVYLRKSPRAGADPVLVVEVDSHTLLSDFNAKRELYLGRLASHGLQVSGLEFRFALRKAPAREDVSARAWRLPELSPDEQAEVDALVGQVAESLRPSVAKAIGASWRRNRRS